MTDVTTGATVVFGTSAFSAELLSIGLPSMARGTVDTSHMGTTVALTHLPVDLIEWGELELELNFDPDEEPPLSGAAETVTITFPTPAGGASGATISTKGSSAARELTPALVR